MMSPRYPRPMTDHDPEPDAIVEPLVSAGPVEEYDEVDVKPRCGFVVLAPGQSAGVA